MFLLFGGQTYYAGGGWNDYQGSYSTAEEAVSVGEAKMEASNNYKLRTYQDLQWYHVVDCDLGEIIHRAGDNYS